MEAETYALIGAAATAVTNAAVNMITMLFPTRPKYVAAVLALMVAVSASYLAALVYVPPAFDFDRQVHASLILSGLFAGFAAAGLTYSQQSAENSRHNAIVGNRLARIYNAGGGR
jgi:hypothetical protein